jgi:hypothetical protein
MHKEPAHAYEWFGCNKCSIVWLASLRPIHKLQVRDTFRDNANCPCCNGLTSHFTGLPSRPFKTAFSGTIHQLKPLLEQEGKAA